MYSHMNPIGFEKISSEIDILIKIFKYLDFEDQLKLAQVNVLSQVVFRTYICKATYRSLEIRDHGSLHVVVRNETAANWLYLHHNVFKHFLEVYAADVHELAIDCLDTIDCMGIFKNLSSLSIGKTCLPLHFDVIVENCPKLKSLQVIVHSLDMPRAYCKRLRQMRNLKRLVLTVYADIEYIDFREFLANLKCQHLNLRAAIKYQEIFNKRRELHITRPICLKELDVVLSKYYENSKPTAIFSCLARCENLLTLTIRLSDLAVNEEGLQIICQNCRNLQKLTIQDSIFRIENFSAPPGVSEISLIRCQGLTCKNLSQMLSQLNIRKFTSIETKFTGDLHDFYMTPFIESLKCDSINTLALLSASAGAMQRQSLKEISWYDSAVAADAPLAMFCQHLETINIECNPLSLDTLMQLTHLTTLRFQAASHLNWSYITALLKRVPLHELSFYNAYDQVTLEQGDCPNRGFSTKIQTIKIREGSAVSRALHFWLDLLSQNAQLKLIWFNIFGMRRFLKGLLRSKHFPRDLQTINVSGINISCNDLRRRFNDTVMEFSFLNFDNRHVTLCRNYK